METYFCIALSLLFSGIFDAAWIFDSGNSDVSLREKETLDVES
jgi:hypothetical protein